MFSNIRFFMLLGFIFVIAGCGRPQRGTASDPSQAGLDELVRSSEDNRPFAFLTSDYQQTTEVHFSNSSRIYLLEGGDHDARIVDDELWVYARDKRGSLLRFSQNGDLIAKLPSIEGGGIQGLEIFQGQKLLTKNYSCQLHTLQGNPSAVDFSQFLETQKYCQEVEMKTGTEANKIFGMFHWQGQDYLTTYQKLFPLKEVDGQVRFAGQAVALTFGNPYAKIKTWPNENGFLIAAQTGTYIGDFTSGIEIWNDPQEKLKTFNVQELLGRPLARVMDMAIGQGGDLFVLVNEWANDGQIKSTVVEIQWLGQEHWRVLSEFDGLAMAISLMSGKQLVVSTDLGLRWMDLSSTQIKEKLIDTDAQGKKLQNPSRLFIF